MASVSDERNAANVFVGQHRLSLNAQNQVNEMFEFQTISVVVSVGESVADLVASNSAGSAGDDGGGTLVFSLNHALFGRDFDALVVSVSGCAIQIDHGSSARRELQDHNNGVVVVHFLDGTQEGVSSAVHFNRLLAQDPTNDVNVVAAAVVVDATRGLQELEGRQGVIARSGLDHVHFAEFTAANGLLELNEARVKSSLVS